MRPSPELLALVERQCGLVHLGQLGEHGVTREQLRGRLAEEWRMVLPRVVATRSGPLTATQRMVAAQLFAGTGALISGAAAAHWHGVTAAHVERVTVEVPHARRPRDTSFVRVRRTIRPERHPWQRDPLVLVSRERAVAAAARECRFERDATAIVLEALQRRLVRLDDLRHELECGPRAGGALLRRAIEAAERGAWSPPEADLEALLAQSRVLPPPWLNPSLHTDHGVRLPRPDAWFDDVGLAVQVHSHRYHSQPADWDATVMADGLLVECGVVVVAVTPRAIRDEPSRLLTRVERAYAQAARRPRPAVRATPIASVA